MTVSDFDPLFGEPQKEIPLAGAPLARVIAQVQFTPIFSIRSEAYVAPFQEAIRSYYPNVEQEKINLLPLLAVAGEERTGITWRFLCSKEDWRVSLAPSFIALETTAYTSRADFMERFKVVVAALKSTVGSARMARVGVRYVNRMKSPEIDSLGDLLRPEMLGIASTPLLGRMQHTVTEVFCDVAEGKLLAKWGVLPPNGSHDPFVAPPVATKSWFLDLDVSKHYDEPFEEMDANAVHATAVSLATRSYSFFRWATTDRFIAVHGGQL